MGALRSNPARPPLGQRVWQDATLVLPEAAPHQWKNKITGEAIRAADGKLPVHRIFGHFPVAVLAGR